jgi:hypothetical protein
MTCTEKLLSMVLKAAVLVMVLKAAVLAMTLTAGRGIREKQSQSSRGEVAWAL